MISNRHCFHDAHPVLNNIDIEVNYHHLRVLYLNMLHALEQALASGINTTEAVVHAQPNFPYTCFLESGG